MNREEFKQRMKSLKSYREQNPDKGYWDWKVEQFQDGGEKDPRKEYVSSSYRDRYPNILEKLQPYSSIKVRDKSSLLLNQFSKADSIIYTPILDRVEKYLQNNDITTDQEKRNAEIVATGIPEIVLGSNALNSGKEWKGLSEGQELINNKVRKLTDNDIKRIFNADILHISPKEAVKLIPKGLNVIDMVKVGKYVNSDRFRNDYPAATLYADRLRRNSYEQGGEVPPSNYRGSNEPVNVNPFTKKPLANGAITPVLGLEGAANFTPVGDILSIRDAYIAAQNKDLLGLSLAGLGILPLVPRLGRARAAKRTLDSPTIPTVDRDHFQKRFEEMERRDAKRHQVADDFYRQRNEVLESLIENEDVFRRSANSDRLYGTNYKRVYEEAIKTYDKDKSPYNDDLPQMAFDHRLYKTDIKGQVDPKQLHRITINPRYSDLDELDDGFQRINEGLVRHEMGHITDEKAGKGLVDRLADPTKFVDEAQLQEMYPRTYRSFSKNILRRGSEIKSYMNEFRDFLAHQGIYSSKETVNSFRKKLDQYGDQFKVLRRIFDSYKNKRDFIKDYNTIPILGTGAIGINYYFNQQEEE